MSHKGSAYRYPVEMTQSGDKDLLVLEGLLCKTKLSISAYCFFVKSFYRIILIVHAFTQHHDYYAYLYKDYSYIPGEG